MLDLCVYYMLVCVAGDFCLCVFLLCVGGCEIVCVLYIFVFLFRCVCVCIWRCVYTALHTERVCVLVVDALQLLCVSV